MDIKLDQYDGFHMMPDENNMASTQFKFFKIKEDYLQGETIGKTSIGETYNVLFLKKTKDGIELNDVFEAVFADPVVYAEGLIGINLYGTFVKKTEEAQEWFDDYIRLTKKRIDDINFELKGE
jgi:hypothetical protein